MTTPAPASSKPLRISLSGLSLSYVATPGTPAASIGISLPPPSVEFNLSDPLRSDLLSAMGLALDRANHKFFRNHTAPAPTEQQASHLLFGVLDEGVAWMGSFIFTENAIHFQHPCLSSCRYVAPEAGAPRKLEFNSNFPCSSPEQIDHLTGEWGSFGQPSDLHLTTIRDYSGQYDGGSSEKLRQSNALNLETYRKTPIHKRPGDQGQQFIHMIARREELKMWAHLTKAMPIGSSKNSNNGIIPTNLTLEQLSDPHHDSARFTRQLTNVAHVFDLRSQAFSWSDEIALELTTLVSSNDAAGWQMHAGGNHLSYLNEVKANDDLSFSLTKSDTSCIPENTKIGVYFTIGPLPESISGAAFISLSFINDMGQKVFEIPEIDIRKALTSESNP